MEVSPVTVDDRPVYVCACSSVVCGRIVTVCTSTVIVLAAIVTVQAERVQIFSRKKIRSNRAVHV
jgi:tRNA A37 threonylcarbamoyladenosine synthetase subunit TsaC/SUA5/YrdC